MDCWNLRYGSHLSYRLPNDPLFPFSARAADPVAQIEFAASIGFAGVLYAYAVTASDDEIDRVSASCARLGVEVGTTLFAPHQDIKIPLWGRSDQASRDEIDRRLARALDLAGRLPTRHVAVLSGEDPEQPHVDQIDALVENLKRVADRAAAAGVVLELEPMSRQRLPGMLLHGIEETLSVLRRVSHPAVRLMFDTGHVHDNEGDVTTWLRDAWEWVEIVQIADQPGRVEPGAGEIPLGDVLEELVRRNFRGLVELEHGWSSPGLASEQAGLARLREMDRNAALAVRAA